MPQEIEGEPIISESNNPKGPPALACYGIFWNPFVIDWPNKKLLGTGRTEKKKYVINFWEACGIYVLFHEFKPVYVGQTDRMGPRLEEHMTDRLVARWDMFSWFSINHPNWKSGGVRKVKNRALKMPLIVRTFELLLIHITTPPLNRQYGSMPNAHEFKQGNAKQPKTIREYMEALSMRNLMPADGENATPDS